MIYLRELGHQQILDAQRQSHSIWGAGHSLKERVKKLERLMSDYGPGQLSMSGLVDERGKVLCSLKRYHVILKQKSVTIPTVGLGAIFTPKKMRKQGLANKLIETVLLESKTEGCEAALLFSDINPGYYKKYGFVEIPAFTWSGSVNTLPKAPALETRPATSDDLPQMMGWYESSWPKDYLRPARDEAIWRFFRGRNFKCQDLILIDQGRDVGYLSCVPDRGILYVEEGVVPAKLRKRFWATVGGFARSSKKKRVGGWLRSDSVPAGFKKQRRKKAIPMIAELGEAFLPKKLSATHVHLGSLDHF